MAALAVRLRATFSMNICYGHNAASLIPHVLHVISGRAEEQMCGIHAPTSIGENARSHERVRSPLRRDLQTIPNIRGRPWRERRSARIESPLESS